MPSFSDLSIKTKVASLLLLLGLLTVGLALFSASRMRGIDAGYQTLTRSTLPSNTDLARANRRALDLVLEGYRSLGSETGSQMMATRKALDSAFEKGLGNFKDAEKTDPSLVAKLEPIRARYVRLHDQVGEAVTLVSQGRQDEGRRLLSQADGELDSLAQEISDVIYARVEESDKVTDALADGAAAATWLALLFSIGGVIAALAAAMLVAQKTITAPLLALQRRMETLAAGEIAGEVDGTSRKDEIGGMAKALLVFRDAASAKAEADRARREAEAEREKVVETLSGELGKLAEGDLTGGIAAEFSASFQALKTNFNAALSALRGLIGSVGESTARIRTGSNEIAQASEDLARRTESNAASLEETSAALVQIDTRIKATAKAADRTVERADQTISTVSGGRAVAEEAVQAMGRVSESAKGIDNVIEGLDKIAFQTRVLAMNAAVEAGRAGEAGRGFAVVADLVSALAMRAEEEAKRARDQLTVTQSEIVSAVDAVQRVDGALADISGDVGEVHQLLGTMAADNQAQASAITQISAAVGSMDQATQQNAAMVEETSAAARNLTSEVETLAGQAARFRTGENAGAARASAVRPKHFVPARPRANGAAGGSYVSPVKALPSEPGKPVAADDDWKDF